MSTPIDFSKQALMLGLTAFILCVGTLCSCSQHQGRLYVRNDSKLTVSFEISGLGQEWTSKPMAPGGKELVDREVTGKAPNVHLSVKDTSNGKTLIIEHLGPEIAEGKSESGDRVIAYPPLP